MPTDYQRFILLTAPRSGTHMLRSALLEHPNIVMHPELFNEAAGAFHPYPLSEPASRVLHNFAFRPFPEGRTAVGFPIHVQQASPTQGAAWQSVWAELAADRDLLVIQLRRHNQLRRLVSWLRARLSNQWSLYQNVRKKPGLPKLKIAPQTAIQWLRQQQELRALRDQEFSRHRQIDVFYEELCATPEEQIDRVLDLLDLPSHPAVTPTTTKQGEQKLRDMIANYEELRAGLANTPWADDFDD